MKTNSFPIGEFIFMLNTDWQKNVKLNTKKF